MTHLDDAGKLVLRLTIGILILLHGIGKLFGGIGGIEAMLAANGLPAMLAWSVYIGEILAPLLLIVGIYTRPAALVVAINMLFAIGLAHSGEILALTRTVAWAIELQALFLFDAVAEAFLGAGSHSVAGKGARFN